MTHPGLRRPTNEDSVVARPGLGLYVVCDGMGGHAAGEVASRIAADSIEAFVQHTEGVDPSFTWPSGYRPELGIDGNRLMAAFFLANRGIDQRMLDEPELRGMATTAVCLLLANDANVLAPGAGGSRGYGAPGPAQAHDTVKLDAPPAWARGDSAQRSGDAPAPGARSAAPGAGDGTVSALVAHVGDSRAYLWRDGALEPITRDHSWVEEQIAAGSLSADEARAHPWRNLVTRALAGVDDPDVELTPVAIERGDCVLLCSDGLTTPLPDPAIAGILAKMAKGQAEATCQALVDAANAAGGPDNITVIIVEIQ